MTDIHCHILPCVDDGASTTEEAVNILRSEVQQGVKTICFTPHFRDKMFTSPDKHIIEAFYALAENEIVRRMGIGLYLSREYYYNDAFVQKLESGAILPMGSRYILLVEFPLDIPARTLMYASKQIKNCGYCPMYAHIERYSAIQKDISLAQKLVEKGVIVQVNANSLLGIDGWRLKRVSNMLIKAGVVSVVASDAHDLENRSPNMLKCKDFLTKRYGAETAQLLLQDNPYNILL